MFSYEGLSSVLHNRQKFDGVFEKKVFKVIKSAQKLHKVIYNNAAIHYRNASIYLKAISELLINRLESVE